MVIMMMLMMRDNRITTRKEPEKYCERINEFHEKSQSPTPNIS